MSMISLRRALRVLPCLGLAGAVALTARTAPVPAAAAPFHVASQCWLGTPRGEPPFAWPFYHPKDRENAAYMKRHKRKPLPGSLPKCRTSRQGIKDTTPRNAIVTDLRTTRLARHQEWPVVDSLGHAFGTIEMRSTPKQADSWRVTRTRDQEVWDVGAAIIIIKGRVCTKFTGDPPFSESRHVHVRLRFAAQGTAVDASEDVEADEPGRFALSFGGLIDRRALPSRVQGRARSATSGCGTSTPLDLAAPRTVGEVFGLIGSPARPKYVSENRVKNLDAASVPGQRRGTDIRDSYLDEVFGVAALVVSTTAVDGGGYVAAIVPLGTLFERADGFDYADPNHPCDSADGVKWSYGRIKLGRGPVWGWLPTSVQVPSRPC